MVIVLPVSSARSIRWPTPPNTSSIPRWTRPSLASRSPTPAAVSVATVPASRTPARTRCVTAGAKGEPGARPDLAPGVAGEEIVERGRQRIGGGLDPLDVRLPQHGRPYRAAAGAAGLVIHAGSLLLEKAQDQDGELFWPF